ncbi:MAG: hypothetical protein AAF950_11235 [Pseudomonadota bacterium]
MSGLGTATAQTPFETQKDLCNAAIIDAVGSVSEDVRLEARYWSEDTHEDTFSYSLSFEDGWGIAKCVIANGQVRDVELPRSYVRQLERTDYVRLAELRRQN